MAPRWLAHPFALLTVGLALVPGCAWFFRRPRNEGSTSAEGVRVMVVRQVCLLNEDPIADDGLSELVLELRVRNATSTPVKLNPAAIRLGIPDQPPMAPTSIDEDAPHHAPAGASESFELRFKTSDCCPDDTLFLSVGGSVTVGRHRIPFSPIAFGAPCEGADSTSY